MFALGFNHVRGKVAIRTRVAVVSAVLLALGMINVPAARAATPSLKVVDVSVIERDAAGLVANVKVQLSQAMTRRVAVDFTTVNGTAKAPADYAAKSGTLAFSAGTRTKTVSVPIKGDVLDEANETFKVKISNPLRARISDGVGVVTIKDNDPLPRVSVADVQAFEGNSGVTTLRVPVTLSTRSGRRVSVPYSITPGTAVFNTDYTVTPTSGTLVFPAGVVKKFVSISMIGDTVDEVPETVNLALVSPVNAVITDGTGVATIKDDDGPNITINNVSKNEGWTTPNAFNFTVSLSAPSVETVTVDYATANGTAVAPGDYAPTSGTLEFTPGQTAKPVTVNAVGDLAIEADETFVVDLSSPVNGVITDNQGVGTIANDDLSSTDEGLAAAAFLGSVSGDSGSTSVGSGVQSILLGDADWFRINLNETQLNPFSAVPLYARINLNVFEGPPQTSGDIDMQIFRANGTLVGSSSNSATADELFFVRKADTTTLFADPSDSTHFYVKVYGFGSVMNNYSLLVNGNMTGTPVGDL